MVNSATGANCVAKHNHVVIMQAYSIIRLDSWVAGMAKEGCGIRKMARLLRVSIDIIIKSIKRIALSVSKPKVIKK